MAPLNVISAYVLAALAVCRRRLVAQACTGAPRAIRHRGSLAAQRSSIDLRVESAATEKTRTRWCRWAVHQCQQKRLVSKPSFPANWTIFVGAPVKLVEHMFLAVLLLPAVAIHSGASCRGYRGVNRDFHALR
jgi:hypothetical protein